MCDSLLDTIFNYEVFYPFSSHHQFQQPFSGSETGLNSNFRSVSV